MTIDALSPDAISLGQASKLMPPGRNGAQPYLSTLIRWVVDGVKDVKGRRVRLEAIRLGSRWITSREAIRDFCAALSGESHVVHRVAPSERTRIAGRRGAFEKAVKELKAAGI